ncbi:hypothetical protein TrST_g103 [Triparma strigata]|uniref:Aspartyl/asparaginy/proline hydroxylase domain-containing protein n=1 Tax=Triparma strigata TaxID=1606541 RepID=A0A9W7A7W1_9STRA|nr:hypothetical protein TrST_g103 [Triparma strigata]
MILYFVGFLPVLVLLILLASLALITDHKSARETPLNTVLSKVLLPREGFVGGLWRESELVSVSDLQSVRDKLRGGGWKILRDEYEMFVNRNSHNFAASACLEFPFQKTLILRLMGTDIHETQADFPRSMELLKDAPFHSMSFYMMDGKSELAPHRGVFSGSLRYHMALSVPSDANEGNLESEIINSLLPSGPSLPKTRFVICDKDMSTFSAGQTGDSGCSQPSDWSVHPWKEGHDFVFDEMDTHYAVQGSPDPRLIFLADFPRPNLNWWWRVLLHGVVWGLMPRLDSINVYARTYSKHLQLLKDRKKWTDNEFHIMCAMMMLGDVDDWAEGITLTEPET